MNRRQKIVQQQFLQNEEAVIRKLKQVYNQSLKDIEKKAQTLQDDINRLGTLANLAVNDEEKAKLLSMQQSKIYQKQYQDAMKKQVGSILDNMQVEEFKTVDEYLRKCYEDGFIGTMYDLQGQGIPMCIPLDQEAMVRAVQLDSKISKGLYARLGEDVTSLKKKITSQVSRGISTGMSFQQVAKQLAGSTNIGFNNAVRIARTEGHRIQVQSSMDACYKAKEKGADVVKQWDATLDDRTRESHTQVDGEIRELDKKFSNGLMFPGDPAGGAAEVINCRCALLQRAKWALDEAELETLKKRAEYFGLDKYDDFVDYKKNYLEAAKADDVNAKKLLTNIKGTPLYDEIADSLEMYVGGGYSSVADALDYDKLKLQYITDSMTDYNKPLYRVEEAAYTFDKRNLKKGQTFSFDDDLRSFTRSKDFITNSFGPYSDVEYDAPVVFQTLGTTKHFNMDKFAENYFEDQSESLVGGTFEVVRVYEEYLNRQKVKFVIIKQIPRP